MCADGQAATDHGRRLNIGRTQRCRNLYPRRTAVVQDGIYIGKASAGRQADRTNGGQATIHGDILVGSSRNFVTGIDAIGVDRTTRRTQDHIAGRRQTARGICIARSGRRRGQCEVTR